MTYAQKHLPTMRDTSRRDCCARQCAVHDEQTLESLMCDYVLECLQMTEEMSALFNPLHKSDE